MLIQDEKCSDKKSNGKVKSDFGIRRELQFILGLVLQQKLKRKVYMGRNKKTRKNSGSGYFQ